MSIVTDSDVLKDYILQYKLKPGHKLPGERKLSAELGVSRSLLREILKSYESAGIIKRLPKSGTILAEFDITQSIQLPMSISAGTDIDMKKLLEARLVLEIGILPVLIQSAKNNQLDYLLSVANDLDLHALDVNTIIEYDKRFHQELISLANNQYLGIVNDVVNMFFSHVKNNNYIVEYEEILRAKNEHINIVNALKSRDFLKAYNCIYSHLIFPNK